MKTILQVVVIRQERRATKVTTPIPSMVIPALLSTLLTCHADSADINVTNDSEFRAALNTAMDGDSILLAPGVYTGGLYQEGLTGVTIASLDPNNRAVVRGGVNGIQLTDATRVTIADLVFEQQTGNGVNIDDGDSFSTPSTQITLRSLVVRDIATSGNRDGIKMSGVTGFHIDGVRILNWGDGGSAFDFVGVHNGLVENSLARHASISDGGNGLRAKGGSKNVTFRANRVELPNGNGRALQAGGQTDAEYFRFIDGDSGYEADNITFEGNVVTRGSASFVFVNIDGGLFHSNYVWRPDDYFVRILNENQESPIVSTQNGELRRNVLIYSNTASEFNTAVNIGSQTLPNTFTFEGNQWLNLANPADSVPTLPAPEVGGMYGVTPPFDANTGIAWQFDWGKWFVNATENVSTIPVPGRNFLQAIAGEASTFDPLATNPFEGDWMFVPFSGNSLQLQPFSQTYLRLLPSPTGDFNNDQLWNCSDIDALVVAIAAGSTDLTFDMNGDGVVTFADITDLGAGWLTVGGSRNAGVTGGNSFLVGDANLNGAVDGSDFGIWNANKFSNIAAWCSGDFTADGAIDGSDFGLWNANKFKSSSTSSVPEPWGHSHYPSLAAVVLGLLRITHRPGRREVTRVQALPLE